MTLGARRLVVVAAAAAIVVVIAAVALNRDGPDVDVESAPTLDEMADNLGTPVMEMIYRGNVPDRTGEILLIPKPHFYLGIEQDLETYESGTPEPFTTHPNPWNYLARVPLIIYGPGRVDAGATPYDKVDLTALAPTYARMLGMAFDAEGKPLPRGIDYDAAPPRLIFTIVIDGGGWNVLQAYPGAWPNIEKLARQGTSYQNALIGSYPAQTGAIHGNIGTGTYPRTHGLPYNRYFENADPQYLEVPTLGDLWDANNGNEPIVGAMAVLSNHLAMIGHGADFEGGDHDIGVIWEIDEQHWTTNESFYEVPDYIAELDEDRLVRYEQQLDERDGIVDGVWFGNDLPSLREGLRRASNPAFERYQADDIVKVIETEPLGQDELTDLFYVQFKAPDEAGHIWNMVEPEIGDILSEVDTQIARLKKVLDARVGSDNYVMVITADHGQQPLAQSVGGWMINSNELERDVQKELGVEARVRSHQFNVTDANGVSIEEIARFLAGYTIGDNIPEGIPGEFRVGKGRRSELVFAGAFPTGYLEKLTREDIKSFGDSKWKEGVLTIEDPSKG